MTRTSVTGSWPCRRDRLADDLHRRRGAEAGERKKADCARGFGRRAARRPAGRTGRGTALVDRRRRSAPAAARSASSSCARDRTRDSGRAIGRSCAAEDLRRRAERGPARPRRSTKALRVRFPREPDPERPPSLSESVRLVPDAVSAGTAPKTSPQTSEAASVKSSTVRIDADHLESLNWQPLGDDGAEEPKRPPRRAAVRRRRRCARGRGFRPAAAGRVAPVRRRAQRARRALAGGRSRAPAAGWRRWRRRSAERRRRRAASTIRAGRTSPVSCSRSGTTRDVQPVLKSGNISRQVRGHARHVELRALGGDAGLQPADDHQRASARRSRLRGESDWQPDVDALVEKREAGRHDADNGVWRALRDRSAVPGSPDRRRSAAATADR